MIKKNFNTQSSFKLNLRFLALFVLFKNESFSTTLKEETSSFNDQEDPDFSGTRNIDSNKSNTIDFSNSYSDKFNLLCHIINGFWNSFSIDDEKKNLLNEILNINYRNGIFDEQSYQNLNSEIRVIKENFYKEYESQGDKVNKFCEFFQLDWNGGLGLAKHDQNSKKRVFSQDNFEIFLKYLKSDNENTINFEKDEELKKIEKIYQNLFESLTKNIDNNHLTIESEKVTENSINKDVCNLFFDVVKICYENLFKPSIEAAKKEEKEINKNNQQMKEEDSFLYTTVGDGEDYTQKTQKLKDIFQQRSQEEEEKLKDFLNKKKEDISIFSLEELLEKIIGIINIKEKLSFLKTINEKLIKKLENNNVEENENNKEEKLKIEELQKITEEYIGKDNNLNMESLLKLSQFFVFALNVEDNNDYNISQDLKLKIIIELENIFNNKHSMNDSLQISYKNKEKKKLINLLRTLKEDLNKINESYDNKDELNEIKSAVNDKLTNINNILESENLFDIFIKKQPPVNSLLEKLNGIVPNIYNNYSIKDLESFNNEVLKAVGNENQDAIRLYNVLSEDILNKIINITSLNEKEMENFYLDIFMELLNLDSKTQESISILSIVASVIEDGISSNSNNEIINEYIKNFINNSGSNTSTLEILKSKTKEDIKQFLNTVKIKQNFNVIFVYNISSIKKIFEYLKFNDNINGYYNNQITSFDNKNYHKEFEFLSSFKDKINSELNSINNIQELLLYKLQNNLLQPQEYKEIIENIDSHVIFKILPESKKISNEEIKNYYNILKNKDLEKIGKEKDSNIIKHIIELSDEYLQSVNEYKTKINNNNNDLIKIKMNLDTSEESQKKIENLEKEINDFQKEIDKINENINKEVNLIIENKAIQKEYTFNTITENFVNREKNNILREKVKKINFYENMSKKDLFSLYLTNQFKFRSNDFSFMNISNENLEKFNLIEKIKNINVRGNDSIKEMINANTTKEDYNNIINIIKEKYLINIESIELDDSNKNIIDTYNTTIADLITSIENSFSKLIENQKSDEVRKTFNIEFVSIVDLLNNISEKVSELKINFNKDIFSEDELEEITINNFDFASSKSFDEIFVNFMNEFNLSFNDLKNAIIKLKEDNTLSNDQIINEIFNVEDINKISTNSKKVINAIKNISKKDSELDDSQLILEIYKKFIENDLIQGSTFIGNLFLNFSDKAILNYINSKSENVERTSVNINDLINNLKNKISINFKKFNIINNVTKENKNELIELILASDNDTFKSLFDFLNKFNEIEGLNDCLINKNYFNPLNELKSDKSKFNQLDILNTFLNKKFNFQVSIDKDQKEKIVFQNAFGEAIDYIFKMFVEKKDNRNEFNKNYKLITEALKEVFSKVLFSSEYDSNHIFLLSIMGIFGSDTKFQIDGKKIIEEIDLIFKDANNNYETDKIEEVIELIKNPIFNNKKFKTSNFSECQSFNGILEKLKNMKIEFENEEEIKKQNEEVKKQQQEENNKSFISKNKEAITLCAIFALISLGLSYQSKTPTVA